MSVKKNAVVLKKKNGQDIEVLITRLSERDRRYLERIRLAMAEAAAGILPLARLQQLLEEIKEIERQAELQGSTAKKHIFLKEEMSKLDKRYGKFKVKFAIPVKDVFQADGSYKLRLGVCGGPLGNVALGMDRHGIMSVSVGGGGATPDVTEQEMMEIGRGTHQYEVVCEMTVYNLKDSTFPPVKQADCKLAKVVTAEIRRSGTGLSGRGSGKGGLVRKYGGTSESEAAVARALRWLAAHQCPDGGWSFDLKMTPSCQGKCGNSGSAAQARNGATALALLPFLGAGQTHKEGKYKGTVQRGLYFLVNRMKVDPKGGSLHEPGGRMYSHGLAAITLCEAFAMTKDKSLQRPAQASLNFICYAQDPVGGGWRYEPQQAGDTSVVGWQIMALKSGHMAYLKVPPVVVQKAFRYLDSVQEPNSSGSKYGYTGPGAGQATTAIGLLCRMYLGWKKDNPSLERGVQAISQWGPSNDMYYNYYATQVCRHWEGDIWKKWNGVMRDKLVNSQVTDKNTHEYGSWNPGGGHAGSGGRLYETSMSTMTLEVYYRHLPIFRGQAVEEEFRIDE